MIDQKKSRADCHQATFNTSVRNSHFTRLVSFAKGLILLLAVWGWLPIALGEWTNSQRGDTDE